MKMPMWKFLVFCIVGKIIKMMAFAYLGSSILGVLQ
jgi:membrane protein DedA with SNARE-associated domain